MKPLAPALGLIVGILLGAALVEAAPRDQLGKIQGAGKHLDAASTLLKDAPEDFDGHKKKALELITQAQKELDQATAWAKNH